MTNLDHLITSCLAQQRTQLRYIQTENGLHRYKQRWNAECLEENLRRLLTIVSRI